MALVLNAVLMAAFVLVAMWAIYVAPVPGQMALSETAIALMPGFVILASVMLVLAGGVLAIRLGGAIVRAVRRLR